MIMKANAMKSIIFLILISFIPMQIYALAQGDDEIELTTFESEDENFTFEYPAEWFVTEETGAAQLATTQAIYEAFRDGEDTPLLEAEEILMTFFIMPDEFLQLLGADGETLDELANDMLTLLNDPDTIEITSPAEIITYQPDEDDDTEYEFGQIMIMDQQHGLIIVYPITEDITGFAIVATTEDGIDTHSTTIYDMLISAEYTGTIEELTETLLQQ